MNKKEAFVPFVVIGLSVLFAAICLMVILTQGKSAKWISRKMLIGGIILSLNSYTSLHSQEVIITCYLVDNRKKTEFTIKNIEKRKIRAFIKGKSSSLSYRLIDSQNKIKDFGRINEFYATIDQRFNFDIFIKTCVKAGNYKFLFYTLPLEDQTNSNFSVMMNITIKDE